MRLKNQWLFVADVSRLLRELLDALPRCSTALILVTLGLFRARLSPALCGNYCDPFGPSSLSNGIVGQPYFAVFGMPTCPPPPDECPKFDWSFTGSLPPGLNVSEGCALTSSLIGNPTTPGTFNFTVIQSNPGCAISQSYSVVIEPAPPTQTPTPPTPTATPTPFLQVLATTPRSGSASNATAFVATGTLFQTGASLFVGGIAATGVNVLSSTEIAAYTPFLSPGTLNDVTVTNPATFPRSDFPLLTSATLAAGWFADFVDVPQTNEFHDSVEKVFRHGITSGCGGGDYCPADSVTRAQMAVFLLKAEHGSAFLPSPCSGVFLDVSCPGQFTNWIEELWREGISNGCGNGDYCPSSPVTRAQMAVFLLKTKHGFDYTPPGCTGIFGDVTCPGDFTDWIEELYVEGVTSGCSTSPLLYCPNASVNRGQMAIFLVKAFGLQ